MTGPADGVAETVTRSAAGSHALDAFLDELEAPAPSACSGTAAAVSAAMAAALVTMVGRGSPTWADGVGIAAQARALRVRLTTLGTEDAAVFEQACVAMYKGSGTPAQRDFALGEALLRSAEVPLRIGEAAADVAELAALAAVEGTPHLRPDATAAAALAEAAVCAATHLVKINLATVSGDSHSKRAAHLSAAASAARVRALGAPG